MKGLWPNYYILYIIVHNLIIIISDFLAARWERPYSVVMGWVRARLSFAILRAALLCVRGSRTKWRSLGIVDGASLPITAAD